MRTRITEFCESYKLSPRETQVVRTLIEISGNTPAIAEHMGISKFTADNFLKALFLKMGVRSKTEVLRYFILNRRGD